MAEWLTDKKMGHVRGPVSPANTGQERAMASDLEEPILLDSHFFPADLEAQIEVFVDHYNNQKYHESITNLTPAGVYFGRIQAILK